MCIQSKLSSKYLPTTCSIVLMFRVVLGLCTLGTFYNVAVAAKTSNRERSHQQSSASATMAYTCLSNEKCLITVKLLLVTLFLLCLGFGHNDDTK